MIIIFFGMYVKCTMGEQWGKQEELCRRSKRKGAGTSRIKEEGETKRSRGKPCSEGLWVSGAAAEEQFTAFTWDMEGLTANILLLRLSVLVSSLSVRLFVHLSVKYYHQNVRKCKVNVLVIQNNLQMYYNYWCINVLLILMLQLVNKNKDHLNNHFFLLLGCLI